MLKGNNRVILLIKIHLLIGFRSNLTKPFEISDLQKNYLFNYPKLPSLVIAQTRHSGAAALLRDQISKLPFSQPRSGIGLSCPFQGVILMKEERAIERELGWNTADQALIVVEDDPTFAHLMTDLVEIGAQSLAFETADDALTYFLPKPFPLPACDCGSQALPGQIQRDRVY